MGDIKACACLTAPPACPTARRLQVAVPLLQMCDEDELSCVPHYTASARISFRQICAGFERHVTQIKEITHVLCFLVKEQVGI